MKKYLLHFLSIISLFIGSSYALERVDFPKTIADVSFKDRVENLKEGYEPFKDAKSYYQIHVAQTENTKCSEEEIQAILHFNTGIREKGVCRVTSCKDNCFPNAAGTACECRCDASTEIALKARPHVAQVGLKNSKCVVLACDRDYMVNSTEDGCVEVLCSESERNILMSRPHVTGVRVENSRCVVAGCEGDFVVNPTKDGCIIGRCSADEERALRQRDSNIVGVGLEDSRCVVVSCKTDYVVNATKDGCVVGTCSEEDETTLLNKEHVVSVKLENSRCVVASCDTNYEINETKDDCVYSGDECLEPDRSTLLQRENVTEVRMDGNKCIVKACDNDFSVNNSKDACECVSPKEVINGVCSDIGQDSGYTDLFKDINVANEDQGKTIIDLYRRYYKHYTNVTQCSRDDSRCQGGRYDCLVCENGSEVYAFYDLADHRPRHIKKQTFRAVCRIFGGNDTSGKKCECNNRDACNSVKLIYNRKFYDSVPVNCDDTVCKLDL